MSGRKSLRNGVGSIAIAGLLSIALSTPASAVTLFFFKGATHAPNEKVCTSFALDAARKHNLQNIKHDNRTAGEFFRLRLSR